jgi:hypothetical protein
MGFGLQDCLRHSLITLRSSHIIHDEIFHCYPVVCTKFTKHTQSQKETFQVTIMVKPTTGEWRYICNHDPAHQTIECLARSPMLRS